MTISRKIIWSTGMKSSYQAANAKTHLLQLRFSNIWGVRNNLSRQVFVQAASLGIFAIFEYLHWKLRLLRPHSSGLLVQNRLGSLPWQGVWALYLNKTSLEKVKPLRRFQALISCLKCASEALLFYCFSWIDLLPLMLNFLKWFLFSRNIQQRKLSSLVTSSFTTMNDLFTLFARISQIALRLLKIYLFPRV